MKFEYKPIDRTIKKSSNDNTDKPTYGQLEDALAELNRVMKDASQEMNSFVSLLKESQNEQT